MFSTEQVQKEAQKRIMGSVAQRGLIKGDDVPDGSLGAAAMAQGDSLISKFLGTDFVSSQQQVLCINQMNLRDVPGRTTLEKVRPLVTELSAGALSILTERTHKVDPRGDKGVLKAEFQARLENFFLCVLKPQLGDQGVLRNKSVYPDEYDQPAFVEKRLTRAIAPDQFLAIFCPASLVELARAHFPANVEVIPVGFQKQKVTIAIMEVDKYWPSRTFSGNDIRITFERVPQLDVAIKDFVEQRSLPAFATHVVRLPTLMDTQLGVQGGLPLYQRAEQSLQILQLQQQQAATVLQAAFRGFRARAAMKDYLEQHQLVQAHLASHDLEQAAQGLAELTERRALLVKLP